MVLTSRFDESRQGTNAFKVSDKLDPEFLVTVII